MTPLDSRTEMLAAIIGALDTMNEYLMAPWDDHARVRVRSRIALVTELLRDAQGAQDTPAA